MQVEQFFVSFRTLPGMGKVQYILLMLVLIGICLGQAAPVSSIQPSDKFCLDCHSDKTLSKTNAAGKEISLFIDPSKLAASVHKTNACASCHSDMTAKHPDDNIAARPVRC